MKIEHVAASRIMMPVEYSKNGTAKVNVLEVPHECSVPNCPGDLNRRKLELHDDLVTGLQRFSDWIRGKNRDGRPDIVTILETVDALISRAKALK